MSGWKKITGSSGCMLLFLSLCVQADSTRTLYPACQRDTKKRKVTRVEELKIYKETIIVATEVASDPGGMALPNEPDDFSGSWLQPWACGRREGTSAAVELAGVR